MFKYLTLLILFSFSNLNSMFEEKTDYECKECVWKEKIIYDRSSVTAKKIVALCKLSKRRIAIANPMGCIKIFNVDTGKKEKDIYTNDKNIHKIIEIPGNRLVIVSYEVDDYVTDAFYGETIVKVINLGKLSIFKQPQKAIVVNRDDVIYHRSGPKSVIYLKENNLVLTFWDKTFLVDLTLETATQLNTASYSGPFTHLHGITYIKQMADGNFVCKYHFNPGRIVILNKDFKLIQICNNDSISCKLTVLKDRQAFIACNIRVNTPPPNSITYTVLIFTNEKFKFDEIKKNLNNNIPISDLQKIILDYVGDIWQSEEIQKYINVTGTIQDIGNHLEQIKFIQDNKIINKLHVTNLNLSIQLWNFKPLKFIKNITLVNQAQKTVTFKDGTIVVCGEYFIKLLKPNLVTCA